ncbi:hypothetical protein CGC58_10250 [Capnocytophaga stomatis]|uniref:Uncharacterized protein n=1 Tax=Capnocytophaga stomatis TaxID=1848904 RepID=A0A250G1J7_9FLAO|nr:hypothetical protein [Capnocytophaga stomatis]ATA90067.1 hypothetical protein CGC58_10250 [Capnocytophaga stomatis]GIM49000.1 hypothetical protein CAPN003_04520 [Capnocytophaga stomatis]
MEFLKNYFLKKQIQKNLKALEKYSARLGSSISKVGCIVDMDVVKDIEPLLELVKYYNLRPENYIFLGYKQKSEETHTNGVPFLIDKEINWQGKIRNYHADRLSEQEYDILINYFKSPKLPLLLLSSSIKAKLRIGFEGIDDEYNDVIINCKLEDEAVFTTEVKKVLSTMLK